MAGYVEGVDRGQATLFPDRLDDFVGADNPVRVVNAFVDALELRELGFAASGNSFSVRLLHERSRPSYHYRICRLGRGKTRSHHSMLTSEATRSGRH